MPDNQPTTKQPVRMSVMQERTVGFVGMLVLSLSPFFFWNRASGVLPRIGFGILAMIAILGLIDYILDVITLVKWNKNAQNERKQNG